MMYLLVEPDEDKCNKPMRRISSDTTVKCRLYKNTEGMLKMSSLLSRVFLKYAIVCGTLGSVLDADQVMRSIDTYVRCFVSSFSVSYVLDDVRALAMRGANMVSCRYFYVAIGISECVVIL